MATFIVNEGESSMIDNQPTILDNLEDRRVVSFKIRDDKKIVIATELCDEYFFAKMNKAEMEELIRDLQDICNRMVD